MDWTNKQIADAMRVGSARFWPDENYQCTGSWHANGPRGELQRCFVQMLVDSLGVHRAHDRFRIAATAICKAASIEPRECGISGVHISNYLIAMNEAHRTAYLMGQAVSRLPFQELKALVAVAADMLDGGEQPANGQPAEDESLPQDAPPVDVPPPNPAEDESVISPNPTWEMPSENPAPLPTAITNLLVVNPPPTVEKKVREKEFA